MIVINNQEEIEKYRVLGSNTYMFDDKIRFNCDIDIESNIYAFDIYANNIKAKNIDAVNIIANNVNAKDIKALIITANNINADNINAYHIKANTIYYDVFCIAFEKFKCQKIEGRYKNALHKCLNNEIEFVDGEEDN